MVVIGRRDHFTAYGIEQYLTPELLATARAAEGGVVWSEIFLTRWGPA